MIYYPLTTLMIGGIRDILIISTPHDLPLIENLLGDGSRFGITLSYAVQSSPDGLAQAFIIGEEFLKGASKTVLILGDNLLYGSGLQITLRNAITNNEGATVFSYHVANPKSYGVVECGADNNVISIEEKPECPKSNFAAVGLYIFDDRVVEFSKKVKPSERGELEITDLNRMYLNEEKLQNVGLGRGYFWIDTGTTDTLLEASCFVQMVQNRMLYMIGCPEEVAFTLGWLTAEQLAEIAQEFGLKTSYDMYLHELSKSGA